jgi:Tfp pilus assembly protein PilN
MAAVKLNLLPSDYSVSKPVANVLKIVRPLNVALLAVFLAGALGMAGFFIFSSVTLRNLNTANNSLKAQIQAQQEAQQQIVLLKDRLGKIKRIYEVPGASKNFSSMVPFINSIGETNNISEFEVEPQKISLTVAFKSNSELSRFMRSLDSQSPFATVALDSFSYNPASGYTVGMSFTVKK